MNEGELTRWIDDVHKRLDDLRADMARLEDPFWWIVGIQIGAWISIMLAILFRR
jgi:hypothetical protein